MTLPLTKDEWENLQPGDEIHWVGPESRWLILGRVTEWPPSDGVRPSWCRAEYGDPIALIGYLIETPIPDEDVLVFPFHEEAWYKPVTDGTT
jgi:hypothetical protein